MPLIAPPVAPPGLRMPGVAPPPTGPQLPSAASLEALKNVRRAILEAAGALQKISQMEPLLSDAVAPLMKHLEGFMEASGKVLMGVRDGVPAPRRGGGEPLDRTPPGVGAEGGEPAVPLMRLAGIRAPGPPGAM